MRWALCVSGFHERHRVRRTDQFRTQFVAGPCAAMHAKAMPVYLRLDDGRASVRSAILHRATNARIETAYVDASKPWQNGTNATFNGKFRSRRPSVEWTGTRHDG
jgi:hypothetical protein